MYQLSVIIIIATAKQTQYYTEVQSIAKAKAASAENPEKDDSYGPQGTSAPWVVPTAIMDFPGKEAKQRGREEERKDERKELRVERRGEG